MPYTEERASYAYAFYTSSTAIVADGNTGIIATPLVADGGTAIYPLYILAASNGIAGAETLDLSIEWYVNVAGDGGAVGTTLFAQHTLANPNRIEEWPGDVTFYDAGRDRVPLLPYHKIIWDISAGASLGFVLYLGYTRVGI